MASRVSNQKRKRGQPSNASVTETASGRASKPAETEKSQLELSTGAEEGGSALGARKPGRPRKDARDAAPEPPPMAETSNPRKRGRPKADRAAETEGDGDGESSRPVKRAKPGPEGGSKANKTQSTATTAGAEPADPSTRRSQRDRRSAEDKPWWQSNAGEKSASAKQPDSGHPKPSANDPAEPSEKRGKPSKSQQTGGAQPKPPTNGPDDSSGKKGKKPRKTPGDEQGPKNAGPAQAEPEGPRQPAKAPKASKGQPAGSEPAKDQATEGEGVRRGARERRSADDKPWWGAQKESKDARPETAPPKKTKRDRLSLGEISVSETQNRVPKASAGQPKGATSKSKGGADKPRRRSSGDAEAGPTQKRQSTEKAQRRRSDPVDHGEKRAERSRTIAKYRHLATRTQHIPRATISAKWSVLDDASIAAVDAIISDASRPVLSHLRDRDSRHQQAQTVLRTFAKRLHSKLVKGLPFPPPSTTTGRGSASSHETELDFERTVDAVQSLEKTLEPLLHSVALLTTERDREEAALEREYKQLKSLELNARAEVKAWRERNKRDHVLAPEIRDVSELLGQKEAIKPSDNKEVSGTVFKDLKDEDLLALSRQIGSHMESMSSNLQQIAGVLPAIVKSKAALQGVLHQHLDPKQYEQVILG